ncbi:hypothetical protein JFL43_09060 [Viridibacillus sp. YIM B01967]|uniref:Uncharacterized protein n=1 Tax=Viridibacillus soli TaxID=2798301 RepID=A0ABS1H6T1_9BACL|nr:hypothetical protein [Viridibacillus soli]MBK3495006.1 hypothetical protein [Viridibacillus soli]
MKFLGKFALTALLALSVSPVVSHAQDVSFESEELKEQISPETLNYILSQAEGDDITIHDVGESIPTMLPFGIFDSYTVSSKVFSHRSPLQAELYASVAHGKTVTMTSKFETTNTVDISGGVPVGAGNVVDASFGTSMTRSIEKGVTLTGPPKGYSSRQYYMTRFKDYGNFVLTEKNTITGNTTKYNKSYSKPSSQDPFVDWSRDIK